METDSPVKPSRRSSRSTRGPSKTGTLRKPRRIVVPTDDIYDEMFTTDLAKIQYYVENSTYQEFIDPLVILELNTKVHELSEEDFRRYTYRLDGLHKVSMLKWYQNIIDRDRRVDIILEKTRNKLEVDEDDIMYLASWSQSNLSFFKSGSSD